MNLQEKINDFIEYKEYSELQVMIKGKPVKKEYLSYIHDTSIPLIERITFWMQCSQFFKHIGTVNDFNNNDLFTRFIHTLKEHDVSLNDSLEIGLYLNHFFIENKINGLFFEMTYDESCQFLEYLLEKNIFLIQTK